MGTALQIALGAEDVRYHDNEECMAEMLERYLRQLPIGEQIIAAQIREQFPAGWEEAEKARAKQDDEELKKVFAAIKTSGGGDNCEAAIKEFKDYLEKENKGRGIIKTGKHFNHELLASAFALYDDNYNDFGGWDSRRNNLAWRKIIGGIQRYVPAATAQAICQGVYYIIEQDKKLERKLTFHYSDVPGAVYYPLDGNLSFRLGEEYAACGAPAQAAAGGERRAAGLAVADFTILCRAKSINVAGLMPRVDNPAKNR